MKDDLLSDDKPIPTIHTLQSDIAEAASKQKISEARILVDLESQRKNTIRNEQKDVIVTHTIRNLFIAFVCLIVIIVSGYSIISLAKERASKPPVPPTQLAQSSQNPQIKELIPYNSTVKLGITSADLQNPNTLISKISKDAHSASDGVTFYDDPGISLNQILPVLSASMPPSLDRTFTDQDFFGGTPDGNFFIIKVDSYDTAYGELLEWENTMGSDIVPIFGETNYEYSPIFTDQVVENKDVRVAVDANGKTLFEYGFYNKDYVIFARNDEVFKDINDVLFRQNI